MNKTSFLIAAALLAAASGTVVAQSPAAAPADAKPSPHSRPKLDANGDGAIDRAEAAARPRLAQRFDALDAAKDGKLDRAELPRRGHHGPHRGRHGHGAFMKLDTDKDGRISRQEAQADPRFAERFERMDVDKNGFVDRADREAAAKQRRDAWFRAADGNGDGSLSKAEYDTAHARRGERADHRRGRAAHGAHAGKGAGLE